MAATSTAERLAALCVALAVGAAAARAEPPRACAPGQPCPPGERCALGVCEPVTTAWRAPRMVLAPVPLFVLGGKGEAAARVGREVAERLGGVLASTGLFAPVGVERWPASWFEEGWVEALVDVPGWWAAGVAVLLQGTVQPAARPGQWRADLWLYDVLDMRRIPVAGGHVEGATASEIVRRLAPWCDAVVRYYTGLPGLSSTVVAATWRASVRAPKQIVLVGLDGHIVRQVTRGSALHLAPAWTRDGRLAWTGYEAGKPAVYLDGRLFVDAGSLNTGVAFSPNGRYAAVTMALEGDPDLYLVDGRTGDVLRRLTRNPGIDGEPSWRPDGRALAFVSDRNGGPSIFEIDLDSGGVRPLTPTCSYCTAPAWSPAGRFLAYDAMVSAGRFDVRVLDTRTGATWNLTAGQGSNEAPAWSPDGRLVVFASTRGSRPGAPRRDLYTVAAGGGRATRLTQESGLFAAPAWSPPGAVPAAP